MKRKVFFILGGVMFAIWFLSLCVTTGTDRFLNQEILSHLTMARRAADAPEMYRHLTKLRHSMERWGMTQGYTVFGPRNDLRRDMAETYRTVVRTQRRVREILELANNPAELLLQDTRLADVRRVVDELEIDTSGHWGHNNPAGIVFFLLSTWGFALAFTFLIAGVGSKK